MIVSQLINTSICQHLMAFGLNCFEL